MDGKTMANAHPGRVTHHAILGSRCFAHRIDPWWELRSRGARQQELWSAELGGREKNRKSGRRGTRGRTGQRNSVCRNSARPPVKLYSETDSQSVRKDSATRAPMAASVSGHFTTGSASLRRL